MRPQNWVFLGDSLTEGVGSARVTFVTELAHQLRASRPGLVVHDLRLRGVDPERFNPFLRVNLAGHLDSADLTGSRALWLWNLGSEGRTIETDLEWVPLLDNLRPERVFILRGSLESILRPACVSDGQWPAWVPRSWRGLVSMDPRCYFSQASWRRLKQSAIDGVKQGVRHRLLRMRPPRPWVEPDVILAHYAVLLQALKPIAGSITVLGLLPPNAATFPGSAAHFTALNTRLATLAAESGAGFVDWSSDVTPHDESLFYRDGFHPNLAGSRRLAAALRHRLPLDLV